MSLTSQQLRWLMEGLTMVPKKMVQKTEPSDLKGRTTTLVFRPSLL